MDKKQIFPMAKNGVIDLQLSVAEVISLIEVLAFAKQTYKFLGDQENTKGAPVTADRMYNQCEVSDILLEKVMVSTQVADASKVMN